MKTINLKKEMLMWAIMSIPFIYLAAIWNNVPDTVALHFNSRGEADGWGSKWLLLMLLLALTAGVYGLMLFIPRIDPKNNLAVFKASYDRIRQIITYMMTAVACLVVLASVQQLENTTKIVMILISLTFAFMGNYFQTIKPNYFVGIRTPWTLESEENWRKTHRMGGRIWFWGGLLTALAILLVAQEYHHYIFIFSVVVLSLVPMIYSFIIFQQKKQVG
jgi:uncharacterized membrane protein